MDRHPLRVRYVAMLAGVLMVGSGFDAASARGEEGVKPGFVFFQPIKPPRPVQVMAHRGLARQAPENTAPAIELAIADGLEWVEVDVRRSKDGVHFLAHDARLDDKTDGKGAVEETEAETLRNLDAGSSFARRFATTRLLTLAEALGLAKDRINVCLDIKSGEAGEIVDEILDAGMQTQVVVFGPAEVIAKVRDLSQGRVAIMAKWHPADGFEGFVARVKPAAVEVDANELTDAISREFHARGVRVEAKVLGDAWDKPEVWARVVKAGADWIQTDLPQDVLWRSIVDRKVRKASQVAFHRGASWYAPENTMPAIERAKALGADYVEVDIRTTKDGRFFLLHDGNLGRTTNGEGPIKNQTADAIAKLEAGAWYGQLFATELVPTFDAGLKALKGHAHVYLDAKEITPEALAAKIEEYGIADESVVYQHPDYLAKLKAINPKIRLMPPLKDPKQIDELAAKLKPYAVDASWGILSKDVIDRCHAHGIRVFSDALGLHENVADYLKAIEWGIDVIQTDHPTRVWRAFEILDAAAAKQP